MSTELIQADVERFMESIGQPVRKYPQNIPHEEQVLRIDLIAEEYGETIEALVDLGNAWRPHVLAGDLADLADGICDLIYVLVGTASAYGIDLQPHWQATQEANMAKVSGPVREDGKRLKPEGWVPPDYERIIREQIAEHEFADRSIKG